MSSGAKPIETMLRMYLLQVWFSLSDEGVEDAIYDSYAMRQFMSLDFTVEQVPDATTLLHFRRLIETHRLGEKLLAEQNRLFDEQGWIMRGGSIVDATIIAAPASTTMPQNVPVRAATNAPLSSHRIHAAMSETMMAMTPTTTIQRPLPFFSFSAMSV